MTCSPSVVTPKVGHLVCSPTSCSVVPSCEKARTREQAGLSIVPESLVRLVRLALAFGLLQESPYYALFPTGGAVAPKMQDVSFLSAPVAVPSSATRAPGTTFHDSLQEQLGTVPPADQGGWIGGGDVASRTTGSTGSHPPKAECWLRETSSPSGGGRLF